MTSSTVLQSRPGSVPSPLLDPGQRHSLSTTSESPPEVGRCCDDQLTSSDGHVMPPHIFEAGLRVNTEIDLQVMDTVALSWIKQGTWDRPEA